VNYTIEYTVRGAGLRHDQGLDNAEALRNVSGKWAPDEGLSIHAVVGT
jgi:hypothetical protein